MKIFLQLITLIYLAAISSGCATSYWTDRGRDAADVFTATIGPGLGAKARIGPAQAGLLVAGDVFGIRCGEYGLFPGHPLGTSEVLSLYPTGVYKNTSLPRFGREHFFTKVVPVNSNTPLQRGKAFHASTVCLPFTSIADQSEYYTQTEIVLGLGISFRLGFNCGEFVDFFLGWTTIDIYGDDLERKRGKATDES